MLRDRVPDSCSAERARSANSLEQIAQYPGLDVAIA
jgi:hypothetical protein